MACTTAGLLGGGEAQQEAAPLLSDADSAGNNADAPILQTSSDEALLISLYEQANPGVVYVDVSAELTEGALSDFGSGSGWIIDAENNYIITNHHVIASADEVRVTLHDGVVLSAEVIGSDQYADIAVLQVTPPDGYTLTALTVGDSNGIRVGQRVAAIGNPFGLSGTMTVGFVSAVGRTLPTSVATSTGLFSNPLIIQTDAAINPGNSGGPLLDSSGRVIGVNVAIQSQTGVNSGVGFAIPVNTVSRVFPQIVETGAVAYPYLGISSQTDVSLSELAIEYDLPVRQGVLIATVQDGAAAERAGLLGGDEVVDFRGRDVSLGGDIIIALDGVPINNFDELLGYLVSNTEVGETVVVTFLRDGEELEADLTLDARPED